MNIVFHQTTFELLQCDPHFSHKLLRKIMALEAALGIQLPGSIREWYSLTDAIKILNLQGDYLHFQPLDIDENRHHLLKTKRLIRNGKYYWQIGDYSSGVYYITEIGKEPNPKVECHDADGSIMDSADEWSNRTFSEFVFTCCWYRRLESVKHARSGVIPSFSSSMISILRESFTEGPRVLRGDVQPNRRNSFTGEILPVNRFQLFFFNQAGMLHLKSRDDLTASGTEVTWTLTSSDKSELLSLISQLKNRGIVTSVGKL